MIEVLIRTEFRMVPMRASVFVVFGLWLCASFAALAQQGAAAGSLELDKKGPKIEKDQILISGSLTLSPGFKRTGQVEVWAFTIKGGFAYVAKVEPKDGKWGPAKLEDVVPGDYLLLASVQLENLKTGEKVGIASKGVKLSVSE